MCLSNLRVLDSYKHREAHGPERPKPTISILPDYETDSRGNKHQGGWLAGVRQESEKHSAFDESPFADRNVIFGKFLSSCNSSDDIVFSDNFIFRYKSKKLTCFDFGPEVAN